MPPLDAVAIESWTYIFLSQSPRNRARVSKAHAPEYGDRNTQSGLSELAILDFGVVERLLETRRELSGSHCHFNVVGRRFLGVVGRNS